MENKGWEFTLNGTPIKTKNFTWGLSLNMYQNYNKVTSRIRRKLMIIRIICKGI